SSSLLSVYGLLWGIHGRLPHQVYHLASGLIYISPTAWALRSSFVIFFNKNLFLLIIYTHIKE
uniref:Uncharacterized protein n=1 Tax=Oryza brachyantha TaxID=4533 RepID=J3MQ88_ORYBR